MIQMSLTNMYAIMITGLVGMHERLIDQGPEVKNVKDLADVCHTTSWGKYKNMYDSQSMNMHSFSYPEGPEHSFPDITTV